MATFTITNTSAGRLLVGTQNLSPNESATLTTLTTEVIRAYRSGVCTISPGLSPTMAGTPLVNSTGGVVSGTLAAITAGGTYAQADLTAIKNGMASLASVLNTTTARVAALEAMVLDTLLDRYGQA